ncbi:MAG: sensor histidine kinase, partial [Chloroflexi bacterium]|nr:sensor histidine kinase [Chloroflexota bacterium]
VVAHEIRNPLAGIGAGLQHMLGKLRSGDELYEDAQRILQESERVDRILEDVLSAGRPLRLNLAPCDLVALLDEALQQRRALLGAQGIGLTRRFSRTRMSLRGDALRLRDAFDRLILNAVEAMPEGGSLEVSLQDSGAEALIAIQDSGPGLSPSEAGARLFEPFYSTKAGRAGLGLAIARRIVEAHGGAIEAQSVLGQGSTFRVRLPLAE